MSKQEIADQLYRDWIMSVHKLGIDRDYLDSRLTQHYRKRAKADYERSQTEAELRWKLYEATCKSIGVWPDKEVIHELAAKEAA